MPGILDESIQLVSVDDAIIALGLYESDYAKVERLVNAVSARIERYTGNVFKKRVITMTLDGPSIQLLDLGGRIISVSSVTVGGQVLLASNYIVLPQRGQLYRAAGWADAGPSGISGVQNVTVVATLGFDPIPYDVQEVALAIVKFWHSSAGIGGGASGFQSERIGDYAYTRFPPTVSSVASLFSVPGDLGESAAAVLSSYVRHGF